MLEHRTVSAYPDAKHMYLATPPSCTHYEIGGAQALSGPYEENCATRASHAECATIGHHRPTSSRVSTASCRLCATPVQQAIHWDGVRGHTNVDKVAVLQKFLHLDH